MVTIEVVRLSVHAFHGVGEQERLVGNDFEVSVSLDYPPAEKAVVTDDLDSTLDFGELRIPRRTKVNSLKSYAM